MVKEGLGSGVKYLDRKSSRPVTWVIKIKHAGLGVLGQKERKIMGFTFWFIMLILFHVALLFMVPWE